MISYSKKVKTNGVSDILISRMKNCYWAHMLMGLRGVNWICAIFLSMCDMNTLLGFHNCWSCFHWQERWYHDLIFTGFVILLFFFCPLVFSTTVGQQQDLDFWEIVYRKYKGGDRIQLYKRVLEEKCSSAINTISKA